MLRQELQTASQPGSGLQRQEFAVLSELSVYAFGREVSGCPVCDLRAGGSLFGWTCGMSEIAGNVGWDDLPGAWSVSGGQMCAVLRDPRSAELYVRYHSGCVQEVW